MTATSSKWNENFILMYEKKKEKKKQKKNIQYSRCILKMSFCFGKVNCELKYQEQK